MNYHRLQHRTCLRLHIVHCLLTSCKMCSVFFFCIYYNTQCYNGYSPLGVILLVVQKLWTVAWTIGGCVRKWWMHTKLKPFSAGKNSRFMDVSPRRVGNSNIVPQRLRPLFKGKQIETIFY